MTSARRRKRHSTGRDDGQVPQSRARPLAGGTPCGPRRNSQVLVQRIASLHGRVGLRHGRGSQERRERRGGVPGRPAARVRNVRVRLSAQYDAMFLRGVEIEGKSLLPRVEAVATIGSLSTVDEDGSAAEDSTVTSEGSKSEVGVLCAHVRQHGRQALAGPPFFRRDQDGHDEVRTWNHDSASSRWLTAVVGDGRAQVFR